MDKNLSDLTTACVKCGFCLESCPTFVLTGDEARSPRGRIALAQTAYEGGLEWNDIRDSMESCLGCRACETACPSGVKYGQILEQSRAKIPPKASQRIALNVLSNPSIIRPLVQLGEFSPTITVPAILGLSKDRPQAQPPQAQKPATWDPVNERTLPPVKGEVYLLEGCVAGALFGRALEATKRLLRRVGYKVRPTPIRCCGAMLAHGGLEAEAKTKAAELVESMPGDLPLIVFTAGCGSTLKEYEHLGQPDFAKRVKDVSEFLAEQGLETALASSRGLPGLVATMHDACHLAHGQQIRQAPRSLIQAIPGIRLVPLNESDMCCGSAGTYNLFQPTMARRLLTRKWDNIVATGADVVVQGNAGCHAWIEQAAREAGSSVQVMHTVELLEASFSGMP